MLKPSHSRFIGLPPDEHPDVTERVLGAASDHRIRHEGFQKRDHLLQIKLPVNASEVTEAGGGAALHLGARIAGHPDAQRLDPPPISLEEREAREGPAYRVRVAGRKLALRFGSGMGWSSS
jgi:hypothetical protein